VNSVSQRLYVTRHAGQGSLAFVDLRWMAAERVLRPALRLTKSEVDKRSRLASHAGPVWSASLQS